MIAAGAVEYGVARYREGGCFQIAHPNDLADDTGIATGVYSEPAALYGVIPGTTRLGGELYILVVQAGHGVAIVGYNGTPAQAVGMRGLRAINGRVQGEIEGERRRGLIAYGDDLSIGRTLPTAVPGVPGAHNFVGVGAIPPPG